MLKIINKIELGILILLFVNSINVYFNPISTVMFILSVITIPFLGIILIDKIRNL